MTTIAEYYARVNDAWPAAAWKAKPTPDELEAACRKLYRFAFGHMPESIERTTGNRYTRCFRSYYVDGVSVKGRLIVNVDKNWHDTVHELSHDIFRIQNPRIKPHSREHARFELKLVKEAVKRGWLEDALKPIPKPPKPPVDPIEQRLGRIAELEKAWQSKQKRATNALAKLARERKLLLKRKERLHLKAA